MPLLPALAPFPFVFLLSIGVVGASRLLNVLIRTASAVSVAVYPAPGRST